MGAKAFVQRTIRLAMRTPVIGRSVIGFYDRRQVFPGWNREHPYDRMHGVQTSGASPGYVLGPDMPPYGAAQPSIIRAALATIPEPQLCHFVDLGCGKGRPLLLATEFGFRVVTGVEFSAALCSIARRNAAVFASSYPARPRVEIIVGDALAYALPDDNLVIFLYRPFDQGGTQRLLNSVESSLRSKPRNLYIVCYNPVWADVLDASPALERRFSAQLPYDATEMGFGPDQSDGVVVWQNRGNPHPLPPGDPNRPVEIVAPGWLAAVVMPG